MLRKQIIGMLTAIFLILTGCANQNQSPVAPDSEANLDRSEAAVTAGNLHTNSNASHRNFRAHLDADFDVLDVETKATGQAIFRFNKNGTQLYYKLIVANIENVVAAHIHLAPSLGVVTGLYSAAPSGAVNGVLTEGTITDSDLSGAEGVTTLSELKSALMNGEGFVRVHTASNPAGLIRGQIH